jgi:AraC family transcriptional regulator
MQLRKICLAGLWQLSMAKRIWVWAVSAGYEKRMLRVLEYIHANPAADMSLDTLADIAAMSRFHWHRVFHAMTGETCAQAVRRIRLNQAASWLLRTDWPVADIAARVGYPSPQSFGRAFRASYGMSPSQFRIFGAEQAPQVLKRQEDHGMYEVTVETTPARRLAALPHRGPYIEIGTAFERAGAIIGARNLWGKVRGMVGVYLSDPSRIPPAELQSFAGYELVEGAAVPEDLEPVDIPDGPIARLRFRGPYAGLHRGYDYLYCNWLPNSGRDPGDAPAFEVYVNTPGDTAPADLLTDICLPLKP